MKTLSHLFESNKKWAESIHQQDPDFFKRLAKQQTPKILWIGCADSRVPATQICGLDPGAMFVHRNIANLVSYRDLNCLSVIDYAVNFLKVTDIIVCGHYGCGGVEGAINQNYLGLINHWIHDISETYERHHHDIQTQCKEHKEKVNRLCELNVERQIENISALPVVQKAWSEGQKLNIHGWIYSIENGLLKDLGHQSDKIADLPKALQLNFTNP
ncbi:MAG: carbonic anhydrase [Bdellovibrionales bacterium]|nr:carbonic anhydrase [Bdellovibrionales bacterium]